jgi:hypothetical protein
MQARPLESEAANPPLSILFYNTLLDSCCVNTAGIPLVLSALWWTRSVGSAISVLPMIMSHSCWNIIPCSALVKIVSDHDPSRAVSKKDFLGLNSVRDKEISDVHMSGPLAA